MLVTLFQATKLVSIDMNVATIAVPSVMHINMLQKRHSNIIKQAIEKHTQIKVDLVFIPKIVEKKVEGKDACPLFKEPEVIQKPMVGHLPRVRPDFTFATLAVSQSNQLAYV